jgi:hypothetical protein
LLRKKDLQTLVMCTTRLFWSRRQNPPSGTSFLVI